MLKDRNKSVAYFLKIGKCHLLGIFHKFVREPYAIFGRRAVVPDRTIMSLKIADFDEKGATNLSETPYVKQQKLSSFGLPGVSRTKNGFLLSSSKPDVITSLALKNLKDKQP